MKINFTNFLVLKFYYLWMKYHKEKKKKLSVFLIEQCIASPKIIFMKIKM